MSLLQSVSNAGQGSRKEELDLRQRATAQKVTTNSGAAVSDAPTGAVGGELAVESYSGDGKMFASLPDEVPRTV